jgi:hypothetical protein
MPAANANAKVDRPGCDRSRCGPAMVDERRWDRNHRRLVVLLPTLDAAAVKRELATAAGGLPVGRGLTSVGMTFCRPRELHFCF